jgi:DNA-binding LacI/PurR family transcriptional regulator
MLGGIGRGLHGLGYDLLIAHASPNDTAWARAYLDSGRADGFILMASNHQPAQLAELVGMGVPFVGWEDPVPGLDYCSVAGDNLTGGLLAGRHLLAAGRRRIAFLGGPPGSLTVQQRYQGYARAHRQPATAWTRAGWPMGLHARLRRRRDATAARSLAGPGRRFRSTAT